MTLKVTCKARFAGRRSSLKSKKKGLTPIFNFPDDVAMAEIAGEMEKAGLPGLMLIVGDGGSYTFHLVEN